MIRYSVWLSLVLGIANSKTGEIFANFKTAENVFKSGIEECRKTNLFSKSELLRMNKTSLSDALKIIGECNENKIQIIPFGDKRYPYCLSVIEDPPAVIYVKGKLPDFDRIPSVCIVGPRKVSDFGKRAAYSLSYRLSKAGITVVSGGALGTDTYAHAGALKANAVTVAVLGCGILYPYLLKNESLRKAICENGCVISEYPPDFPASKYTFPVRNRIMSALSLGTVVIEAAEGSGSLITARHAYEQGRDVFVIPGSPDKKEYSGSNALMRDGAKPLLDASDIFNEYIHRFPDKINIERAYSESIIEPKIKVSSQEIKNNQKNFLETLSKEAKIVYNQLDKQKFYPDEICNTGLSSAELLSALTELEMEFLIKAVRGGMYEKM